MAKVTVDTSGLDRKLKKVKKLIDEDSSKVTEQLAQLGKQRARELAPYYTGRTVRFIRAQKLQTKEGPRWQIQAQNPTKGGKHTWNISGVANRKMPDFNLVRWMHETNGILRGRKHIKSGDPRFMYSTTDYLNRIKRGVAQGTFKNINLR